MGKSRGTQSSNSGFPGPGGNLYLDRAEHPWPVLEDVCCLLSTGFSISSPRTLSPSLGSRLSHVTPHASSPCWTSGSGQQGWLLCSFHSPAAWCPVWMHLQGEPYLPFRKKPAHRSCVGPGPRMGVNGRLFSAPSVASSVCWLSAGNDFARNSLCTWGTRSTCAVISLESVSGSSQAQKSKTGYAQRIKSRSVWEAWENTGT